MRKPVDLPKRNSIRTRLGRVEPEVVFRIVHVAIAERSPPAAFREQTIEVALGPNAAFQGGNVGRLTRQVPPYRVVNTVPPARCKARPPSRSKTAPPRIVETLRKAIEWRRQLDAGEVPNQAAIARREGITRARVTQIMALLRLAPAIRERILSMPRTARQPRVAESALRPIAQTGDSAAQLKEFALLLAASCDEPGLARHVRGDT